MAHSSAVAAAKDRLDRLALALSADPASPADPVRATDAALPVGPAQPVDPPVSAITSAETAPEITVSVGAVDAGARGSSEVGAPPLGQRAEARGRRLRELGDIARDDVRTETVPGPGRWGRVRWRVRPIAVAGAVLIVAVMLGVVGWRTMSVEAHDLPDRTTGALPSVTDGSGNGSDGQPLFPSHAAATPSAEPETVVVHVAGHVRQPGLVSLPSTARIADAIAAAGGASDDADLSRINLARRVTDGEQIFVPDATGDRPGMVEADGATPTDPSQASGVGTGSAVDINHAAAGELQTVPGIGPVLAERIIEWRTAHGPFATVDDLTSVSGIGSATLEKMRAHVRVG